MEFKKGKYIATWKYKDLRGFEKGVEYNIYIDIEDNGKGCYLIKTDNGLMINCASENSINRYFENIKRC